jgi:hypothetical protein
MDLGTAPVGMSLWPGRKTAAQPLREGLDIRGQFNAGLFSFF